MQFKNKKQQDRGDYLFSEEAGRRKGMSRKRGTLEQASWSSHCILHRGCTNKTGPSAPGGDVHGIKDFFQQEGSASNPLWSKTGYK